MLAPRMRSLWSDAGAREAVERWGETHGEALALRVYTSRLIGSDPELVLHGGGNTSLKAERETLLGERVPVLHVKGSGASLDAVEPRHLPALDLRGLRRLRALEALSDEEMVNQLRTHLLEAKAPNPSVETLLHAFLPHRFVDHSHADAVLGLTNQEGGEALVREALGEKVPVLPYVMPGFPLAKQVADAVEAEPEAEGVVLLKHGLFTFGEDARTSYERHVAMVARCEALLRERARRAPKPTPRAAATARTGGAAPEVLAARVAPLLRGLLAEPSGDEDRPFRRVLLEWRGGEAVRDLCASEEIRRLVREGPLTPDHAIRTQAWPCLVEDPPWDEPEALRDALARAVSAHREAYDAYFERGCAARGVARSKLPSAPRVVLIPGAGAFAAGPTKAAARVAADIAEHTLHIKALAEAAGRYEGLSELELFDMEYWSLEQAKLGTRAERPLEGRVVLVTGGAGAIGRGVGEACAAAGGHVLLADLDEARARTAAEGLEARFGAGAATGAALDVTDEASVRAAFDAASRLYGGIDVVVANAGIAHVAPLEELRLEDARRLAEVNYLGVAATLREAARVFRAQGTGGHVVLNASKNVFAPGRDFGAYSASKAAAAQLARVAALELAPLGVRVNQVNADAIFEEGGEPSGLWAEIGPERARRRGLSAEELPEHYRERNLLRARVRARHVGNAVVFFASDAAPTTGAVLPVDGGLPEAFPR